MEHTSERAFVRMTGVGHRYDPTPGSPMAVQGIDLDIHRHERESEVTSSSSMTITTTALTHSPL